MAIETAGAVDMFCRSVSTNELIYDEYLSDGLDVVEAKPYADCNIDPTKCECAGHVQKRLGTRLRHKVTEYKGIKTYKMKTIDAKFLWNSHPTKLFKFVCHEEGYWGYSLALHEVQRER